MFLFLYYLKLNYLELTKARFVKHYFFSDSVHNNYEYWNEGAEQCNKKIRNIYNNLQLPKLNELFKIQFTIKSIVWLFLIEGGYYERAKKNNIDNKISTS